MLQGRILAESLRVGSDIRLSGLRIVRIARVDMSSSAAPGQPQTWTLLDVEAPESAADELAGVLAAGLADDQGWYADFRVGDDHVVVFPGRVFRYTVGDEPGRRAAVEHGRAVGVPDHQLDWGA